MYIIDGRIRYSEIDHNNRITLPAIVNYFQDCCTFHSEDIGQGFHKLKKENHAWILSYWQIVVERYPKMGEQIKVCTWPTGFRGFLGDRNFQMLDEGGTRVAYAHSVWVYMDMEKGRPVKAPKEMIEYYGVEAPLDMEYESRKVEMAENAEELEAFPVRRYHIDTNEHVNNCQYIQMAMEILEKDVRIRQVRVEYKKSAVYGDMIVPRIEKNEDRIAVELCDTEGALYAIVEFKEEK
ncbi:MAG: thioesterase [Eubacteriales bacterium]|nr:thioesterase [Eubacteriales bacterium]